MAPNQKEDIRKPNAIAHPIEEPHVRKTSDIHHALTSSTRHTVITQHGKRHIQRLSIYLLTCPNHGTSKKASRSTILLSMKNINCGQTISQRDINGVNTTSNWRTSWRSPQVSTSTLLMDLDILRILMEGLSVTSQITNQPASHHLSSGCSKAQTHHIDLRRSVTTQGRGLPSYSSKGTRNHSLEHRKRSKRVICRQLAWRLSIHVPSHRHGTFHNTCCIRCARGS